MNINTVVIQVKSDIVSKKMTKEEENEAWNDAQELIRILIMQGYQLKVHSEDWFLVIEYDYQKAELSENVLEWMDYEDYIDFNNWKEEEE